MSDISAFPNGYPCGGCGQFVGWNTTHYCTGRAGRMFTSSGGEPPRPAPTPEDRIAAALERIATALEAGS